MAEKRKYAFGDLNRIEKPIISNGLNAGELTPLMAMREAALNVFSEDTLIGTGPYKAICLRVEPDNRTTKASFGSWVSAVFDKDDSPPALVQIKARIPELHAMIPEPEVYGDVTEGSHQQLIDMHPTFLAQDVTVEKPAPGDIVWVNFGNVANMSDPIYLGTVFKKPTHGGVSGPASSANLFNGCAGNLGITGVSGDSILGGVPVMPEGIPGNNLILTLDKQAKTIAVPFAVNLSQFNNLNLRQFTNSRTKTIKQIIVHHTATAVRTRNGVLIQPPSALGVLIKRKLSTHFEIDINGVVWQYLDPGELVAWHAPNTNSISIGIDLSGPDPEFSELQIERLCDLLRVLCTQYPEITTNMEPYGYIPEIVKQKKPGIYAHKQTQQNKSDPFSPVTADGKGDKLAMTWTDIIARMKSKLYDTTMTAVAALNNASESVPIQLEPNQLPSVPCPEASGVNTLGGTADKDITEMCKKATTGLEKKICNIMQKYGSLIREQAKLLDIPVYIALAVIIIESNGQPYDNQGRLLIRFEPHIFKRRTGLTVKGNGYESFNEAKLLNEEAAYKSISMGMPQVMGFNHVGQGYKSAKEMYIAWSKSDAEQIKGLFTFIRNNSTLAKAARTQNWATFARIYNGTGYAANKYDEKLATYYEAARKLMESAT